MRTIHLIKKDAGYQLNIEGVVIGAHNVCAQNILKQYYQIHHEGYGLVYDLLPDEYKPSCYIIDDNIDYLIELFSAIASAIWKAEQELNKKISIANKAIEEYNQINGKITGNYFGIKKIEFTPISKKEIIKYIESYSCTDEKMDDVPGYWYLNFKK